MTSQYRHRRTSNPATAFPNPLEPGEIAVNTANRQIAIGDAQSGVIGAPLPAIAVRYFDIRAQYVANDFVQNGTSIYRAKGPISPGPFNITQWDMMVGAFDPQYVAKAGDTMTGMLNLPATVPSSGTHATNKTYVDTGLAGKSTIYSAISPPAGVADNSLWFESDTGLLYVKFNDGSSSQWVIACPQPDISNFVLRSGDNMSGPLGVPLTPTLPAHVTSKSYVDAQLAGKSSIISSDTPPVGAIDNSLWYETDSGATYVRYNDLNGGAQWVAIADPANTAYAAPFDAMAYSGMQINGSMEVSQERGSTGTLPDGSGICDGWRAYATQGTSYLVQRTDGGFGAPGASHALLLKATTAKPSFAAGDLAMLYTNIEGYRTVRLSWGAGGSLPQPITIGFWVYATVAGTFSVAVTNKVPVASPDRSYVTNVTVGAASTEYKTITIPADIAGAWLKTNDTGLSVYFVFGAGTDWHTTPNTWTAGYKLATTSTSNFFATLNNQVVITQVVVLPGIEAPRADRSALIMRPYDQELLTCMRYYEQWGTLDEFGIGQCVNATGGNIVIPYVAIKRAAPTVTPSAASTFSITNSAGTPVACTTAVVAGTPGTKTFDLTLAQTSGFVAGNAFRAAPLGGCFIKVDARL